jgi:hypothetical protein
MADVPQTPAERVETLMNDKVQAKPTSYARLKTFTQRYSMPFPLLKASKSSSSNKSKRIEE